MDKVFSNISAVQLNFDGVNTSVYMAENTAFKEKEISEVRFFDAPVGKTLLAPFGGKQLASRSLNGSMYVDLVRVTKDIFMQGMALRDLHIDNDTEYKLGKKINFNMSRVYYTDPSSTASLADKSLLMLVEYGTIYSDNFLLNTQNAVSVHISSADPKVNLGTYIDGYIQQMGKRVRGVSCKTSAGSFYLSLRDRNGQVFELVPSDRLEDNTEAGEIKRYPMLLNDYDVDFRDSYVYNATAGTMTFDLTFYY